MLKAVSTHIFLRQRLHPGLLELLARGGAEGVELFAAKHHFDYTDRATLREFTDWFRSSTLKPHSMHAPLYPDMEMGRSGAPAVNIIHADKARRIDAMDEIKRAIEVAEQIPYPFLIVHLGERGDSWSEQALDHSLTSLEHLRAFARPLGVTLLLENILNEPTQAAHLQEVFSIGHFGDIGVCMDLGHANMGVGVPTVLGELKSRIRSTHIHDNKGDRDSHLWPGDGTIDWKQAIGELKSAPGAPAALLEIHHSLETEPDAIAAKIRATFEFLEVEPV